MTRQMLMTVLARLDGTDTSGNAYAKGMEWAIRNGVSNGSDPSFSIGAAGFEPTASSSRTRRATNCAMPRKSVSYTHLDVYKRQNEHTVCSKK